MALPCPALPTRPRQVCEQLFVVACDIDRAKEFVADPKRSIDRYVSAPQLLAKLKCRTQYDSDTEALVLVPRHS